MQFDGEALLAAFRAGGPAAYWQERREMLDAAVPVAAPSDPLSRCRRLHRTSATPTAAIEHLQRMVDGQRRGGLHRRRSVAAAAARRSALSSAAQTGGVPLPHTASAPHTASTMIGAGDAGARRAADDRSLQRFHLDALPLRQVDQQRRPHRPRDAVDVGARSAR